MRKLNYKKTIAYLFLFSGLFLTSCSKYTGLRTPLYDGEPIQPNKEAIATYSSSGEVIGAEKEFYIRHPFSEDILNKSLTYPEAAPFLLEEGSYIVGEDLPAGRATLLGNESSFSPESYDIHVGNLIVRDEAGEIYFENLFHSAYGQLTAQLDLIEGHEIIIIGKEPEITVFYSDQLPENPYVLMELPDLIKNLDRMDVRQPVEIFDDRKIIHLTAGIYEVGLHFEAGDYLLSDLEAPHHTEMYLFRGSMNPQVFELLLDSSKKPEYLMGYLDSEDEAKITKAVEKKIELIEGDKLYLNLVKKLELIRLDEK